MRALTRRAALSAGAGLLFSGVLSPLPAAVPEANGKIRLWNNANGPHLRGAVITQRRIYPHIDGDGGFMGPGAFGVIYSQEDFHALAKAGANAVFLSHPGIYSEKPPFKLDRQALANLDRLVAMARRARLFVVIGFRTGPGRSEFTFHVGEEGSWFGPEMFNDTLWRSTEARTAWARMWRDTAAHFAANPAVAGYELMVEPNSNMVGLNSAPARPALSDARIFNEKFKGSALDWSRFYPLLVKAVRLGDAETPILVSPNNYASVDFLSTLGRLNDPHLVYSVHYYEPGDYTSQSADAPISLSREALNFGAGFAAVDSFLKIKGTHVAVSEFGVSRWAPGAKDYLGALMAAFEKRGCNHFLFHWPSSHGVYERVINNHNYTFGPSSKRLSPQLANPLMEIISHFWQNNRLRPPVMAEGLRGSR